MKIRCVEGEPCENQGKIDDLLAALRLYLPVMEAYAEASHLTDGFRPRENKNDRILKRVKDAIERAEGRHTNEQNE